MWRYSLEQKKRFYYFLCFRLFLSKLESNQSNLSIISKISHCSDNLEIITRLKNSDQTYKACFQQSMLPFEVVTVATQRPLSGTTITINNYLSLASSLRKKELNSKTILNEVKNLIECFSVIYPKISFSICDCSANSSVSIAQTKKQYNSKKAANHIMGSGHKLIPFHTSSKHYKIKGLVGENDSNFKRPHLTFINSRFFESVEINKLIDSVFLRLFPELDQYYTIILHIKVRSYKVRYCVNK